MNADPTTRAPSSLDAQLQEHGELVLAALEGLIAARNNMRPLLADGQTRPIALDLAESIDLTTFHLGHMLGVLAQRGYLVLGSPASKATAPVEDRGPGRTS